MGARKAALFWIALSAVLMHSLLSVGFAQETSTPHPEKNVAVATLVTTAKYAAGAEVLAESLTKVNAIGDRVLFYVLPDDDPRSDLTDENLQDLRDAGWQTRQLSKENGTFSECMVSVTEQAVVDATPTIKRYWGTCSKFAIWSLTEYDAAVFIDADSLVLNNFDAIYDLVLETQKETVFFAQGTPGCWEDPPDCKEFYGAFFAIKPSMEIQKLLHQVSQTYSAAQGELMLLNNVFRQVWNPLPRYTLVAQTEQLRPPTDPPSIRVDWSKVKVYDFSGLPDTKPWVTYELQKQYDDKYLHAYLGRILADTRNFHIYMYPQWIWNDLYDTVLERKRLSSEDKTCRDGSLT